MISKLTQPIQIWFSNLFPALILNNKLVATIVYNVGALLGQMKSESDIVTNSDI